MFLLFGAFIGRRFRSIKYLHIAGLCFAVIMQIFGWYCPLTHLELWLRQRHDSLLTYRGSFLIYYVERIVYLELTPGTIFALTVILIVVSVFLYKKRSKKGSEVVNHMKHML
jgi:hypothetical protein